METTENIWMKLNMISVHTTIDQSDPLWKGNVKKLNCERSEGKPSVKEKCLSNPVY